MDVPRVVIRHETMQKKTARHEPRGLKYHSGVDDQNLTVTRPQ
jgi:hypothetical protein